RLGRVGQQVPVVRVDVGGDPPCAADRRDRERVVQVPVCQHHGGRVQPVFFEHLLQPVHHADARVDHHAPLTGRGCDHITVGTEGGGGHGCDEHASEGSGVPWLVASGLHVHSGGRLVWH